MATGEGAETLEAAADGAEDGGGGGRTGAEGVGEGGLCVVGIEAVFAELGGVDEQQVVAVEVTLEEEGNVCHLGKRSH